MHHPIGGFSTGNQGVQRPGGRPHEIAAGFIVLWILIGDAAGMDDRAHQPLADVVAHIVVLAGKILLADVVENVIDARRHLVMRQSQGILRVQDRDCLLYTSGKEVFVSNPIS